MAEKRAPLSPSELIVLWTDEWIIRFYRLAIGRVALWKVRSPAGLKVNIKQAWINWIYWESQLVRRGFQPLSLQGCITPEQKVLVPRTFSMLLGRQPVYYSKYFKLRQQR
ncbi:MAG: hypothetical protein A2589_03450 [Candidatus Vogelbacteria bacterium RIFOXYD1_FULL_46_19]|uniref:Uncharacterized protein n=1 Tax=Candidatus Vogelbacteria bacterium RIFOXYD1_FULL_46_19 TaxID=1802439 RepID=A0A1G2QGN5_9BACT|nr:MAG: hypothetical protein A2589_03450 [Candidatus Vogelbacteria bacterium RIFOXYD1_FULL_46_19]